MLFEAFASGFHLQDFEMISERVQTSVYLAIGIFFCEASLAGASDPSFFAWLNPAAVWMFCPHLQGTCCCSGVSQLRTKG